MGGEERKRIIVNATEAQQCQGFTAQRREASLTRQRAPKTVSTWVGASCPNPCPPRRVGRGVQGGQRPPCRGCGAAPHGPVWYTAAVTMHLYKQAAERYPEALPPPYDEIVKEHGFDALYNVSWLLGGMTVHVPQPRALFAHCIKAQILDEFNGYNQRELARKYGYAYNTIKRWVNEK